MATNRSDRLLQPCPICAPMAQVRLLTLVQAGATTAAAEQAQTMRACICDGTGAVAVGLNESDLIRLDEIASGLVNLVRQLQLQALVDSGWVDDQMRDCLRDDAVGRLLADHRGIVAPCRGCGDLTLASGQDAICLDCLASEAEAGAGGLSEDVLEQLATDAGRPPALTRHPDDPDPDDDWKPETDLDDLPMDTDQHRMMDDRNSRISRGRD